MSKIIETLKVSSMEYKNKESGSEIDPQKQKSSHELTQQQLADIYFAGSEKIKKSDYPTVVKVVEKHNVLSVFPWIIAAASVFLMIVILVSNKRVFLDVKILDQRASSLRGVPEDPEGSQEAVDFNGQKSDMRVGDMFHMQDFSFEGAAKLKSLKDRTTLTLINSSVAPFARATLHFSSVMNLASSKIVFYAKGARGGENLAFALKDKDNVPAFSKNKIYPFPNNLTTDWQRAEIPIFSLAKEFDSKAVASLRFEFGSKDTENKSGDTIFVKDLQVIPL